MTRAKDILNSLNENMEVEEILRGEVSHEKASFGKNRERSLDRFLVSGNIHRPVGNVSTNKKLEAAIYSIQQDMQGLYFDIHTMKTDELLRFEDKRYNDILNEVNQFWGLKEEYNNMGFTHKRGLLLYGREGTGKSCLLKQVTEDVIKHDDVIFITKDPNLLVRGLKQFREVEPDRRCLVLMEDIDTIIRYDEHAILELFDGDSQMDGVLFLATTNYIDRLPPRILRAGRFDRKLEIKNPPKEGRLAYFKHKLGLNEDEAKLEELADKTDGFSFGQLREFLVSTYCLKVDKDVAVKRIRNNLEESISEKQLDKELNKIFSSGMRIAESLSGY